MKNSALLLLAIELMITGTTCAQDPTGAITGIVTDASGAVIRGANVVVINTDTGLKRTLVTSDAGDYSASVLLPGSYQVAADATGFGRLAREATVESGSTTNVNFVMQVGGNAETLTVEAASPQIHYESHEVDGMVSGASNRGTTGQWAKLPRTGEA